MSDYYGTADAFLSYLDARGLELPAGVLPSPPDQIVAGLIRATQYIDGNYRLRFPGKRAAGRSQPLEWPRIDATDVEGEEIDDETVPVEIEHATYEAALRELVSPGVLSPDQTATLGTVKRNREKVGPIEEEVEYFEGGSASGPLFRRIDEILSGILIARSNTLVGFLARA